jgi:hypothetical protein
MFKKIVRWLLHILTKKEIEHRTYALGITSFINKGDVDELHCIFLDYDTKDLSFVLSDIKELVEFWNLGSYDIYSTSAGFHVMFWDTHVPYSRLKMIINYSRCDPMFKYISKFHPAKTLRVHGKFKQKDITHVGKFTGSRNPTPKERELGNLKRTEYITLKNMSNMFTDEVLK